MDGLRRAAAAAVFVGGMAAWIYLSPDSSDAAFVGIALGVLAVFHFAAGFAVGRWWAVLLPLLVALVVVPAGGDGEIPAWFGYLLFGGVAGAVLLAAGVALRRFRERRADSGSGHVSGPGPAPGAFAQRGRH